MNAELIDLYRGVQKYMGEWQDIPGYRGYYAINEYGDVLSVRRNKVLVPVKVSNGYLSVQLSVLGKVKRIRIARMVAELFVPNPNGYPQVNHKDGIKTNNHKDNLEWCTQSQNVTHAYDMGLMASERDGNAKLTIRDVKYIRSQKGKKFHREIAEEMGVCKSTIGFILRGESWTRT